jgi:hypothetical protein
MAEADDALLRAFAAGLVDPAATPTELFRGPAEGNAARFALYRGNLTANWERSLGNAYPVLRQLVGEEFFLALARNYGRRVPSASGDLNALGAGLPDFLADFESTRPYPYFPDLARLEWAVHRAHYAADAPPLAAAELAALGPEGLETLACRLRPGHLLLASPWAIAPIWLAHQEPPAAPLPAEPARPCQALVYRPQWRVRVREVTPGEAAALAVLATGAPLAAALEAGLDADPDFDPGAALPAWLAQGLLTPLAKETP